MIYAVRIGPCDPDMLPHKTVLLLKEADGIPGFDTVLNLAEKHFNPNAILISMGYKDQSEKLEQVGKYSREGKKYVVCFMGDVNFSGYEYLERINNLACHSTGSGANDTGCWSGFCQPHPVRKDFG